MMPASAWDQIGPESERGEYPVTGFDGGAYLARRERRQNYGGPGVAGTFREVWTIGRADEYGPGRVTESGSLKGAVQRLNAFHVGETCIHCGRVHSERGHFCDKCGKRRYA
jgi:hypothetical protein